MYLIQAFPLWPYLATHSVAKLKLDRDKEAPFRPSWTGRAADRSHTDIQYAHARTHTRARTHTNPGIHTSITVTVLGTPISNNVLYNSYLVTESWITRGLKSTENVEIQCVSIFLYHSSIGNDFTNIWPTILEGTFMITSYSFWISQAFKSR